MKAVPPGLWLPVAIISIMVLFISPAELNAQSRGSLCKCEDVDNMLSELNLAGSELSDITDSWIDAEPTQMAGENSAILHYFNSKPKIANGDCLKYLFDIYNAKIKGMRIRHTAGKGLRYRDYAIKIGYALNDVINGIMKRLDAIKDEKCRPSFWFGSINYSSVTILHSNQDRPEYGETHTYNDTLTIDGTIRLNGKFSDLYPSSWEAGGKYEEIKNSSGKRPCKGGLRQEGDKHNYETHYIFTWDKSGAPKDKETRVNIGEPEDDKIFIQFRIPEITLEASGYRKGSYKSDCPKPNGDFDGPAEPWNATMPLSSQPVGFPADYLYGKRRSDLYENVTGSYVIESGPTGKTTVYYDLFRLKPLK